MNYKIHTINKNDKKICYIIYDNGKIIELSRNDNHKIIINNKHIFLLRNNSLDKVFDINNKRFITKKIEMQILYNNYNDYLNKKAKKKIYQK